MVVYHRGSESTTTTKIATKLVVVAADHPRPLPISQQNWYWSQQIILDHYQNRNKTGSSRIKSSSTTTNITAKAVLVAGNKTRQLDMKKSGA